MKNRGFTLIELLVVIAIIGILSSIVLITLNKARAKARDSQRLVAFREFGKGLELFYDEYGVYVCGGGGGLSDSSISCPDPSNPMVQGFLNGDPVGASCPGTPKLGLAWAGILSTSCPNDPVNSGSNPRMRYGYKTDATRQIYLLSVYLERDPNRMANDGGLCDDVYEVGPGIGILTPPDLGPPGCL
jgi:prepilin-type N-terminal cleavage/methylation domain-containing protein